MKQFLSQRKWLTSVVCVLLSVALLTSVCLPILGMRTVEPENPILQAQAQDIEVLQAGSSPAGSGNGETGSAEGSGSGGQAESDREGEQETPDPEEPEQQEPGRDSQQEQPQESPVLQELSEASIGTDTNLNQGEDGENAGNEGAVDENLSAADLDLGAVLTWYKYGSQAASMVCAPGEAVGKRVLLVQLDDGKLRYDLDLTGMDAEDAEITGVQFAEGNGIPEDVSLRGTVNLSLPDGAEYRNYIFLVQVHALQQTPDGETVETDLEFTFILRLESGIDLDLQLNWQPDGQATCTANGSVRRTVKRDELNEGMFAYDLEFLGDSAGDAEILSAEYWTTDGERGTLSQSGDLQMAAADGQEQETYYISVTARVALGQQTYSDTISYTFVITYEDGLDLQLLFTWYEKSVTAVQTQCEANERTTISIKHNQLSNGELLYTLALDGNSAEDAQIVSASCNGTQLSQASGSLKLEAGSAGEAMVYTILVMAKVQEKGVTFTITIRYSGDVSLEMRYSIVEDGTVKPCTITCENKKTVAAEPVYDDQLTDGQFSYQLLLNGEDADGVQIDSVKCYQTGNFLTSTLGAPDGSVTLLLNGGKTGDNVFTVTASGTGGDSYTFTINIPYKHKGEDLVQIRTNLLDGDTVTNGQEVNLTVEAWTEDEQHNVTGHITASGTDTKLIVKLDGVTYGMSSSSGYVQQYVLVPDNPDEGDTITHELYIYAEDGEGNFGELTLTLIGKRTEEGQKIGTASIYIDMSVLGLGVRGPIQYDVLSGEPVSYSIAKAIWDYDAGDPYGTSEQSFHWPASRCSYSGSLDRGFYLESMDDGSGLGGRANALSGDWSQFGSTPDEVLAGIDAYFGAGTGEAVLWRCIYRNGIPLSRTSTGIGEFDFTMGSGWMYSVGGSVFYPGSSMSDYFLQDGDTLILRYTLAYGWDVGGGSPGYGNSTGYCVSCVNGSWSIYHSFEAVTAEDGTTQYICNSCGMVQGCPHEHREYRDLEDGTCVETCLDCAEQIGTPKEHVLTYTVDEGTDSHTAVCENCGHTEQAPHTWIEQSNTATCTQPGTLIAECEICHAIKEEAVEATGHMPQNVYEHNQKEHWQVCQICGEKLEDTVAPHKYRQDGGDWVCSVCYAIHGWECSGTLIPDAYQSTCDHLVGACSDCGLPLEKYGAQGEFEAYHTFVQGFCTVCGAQDPNYISPYPDPDPAPEPELGSGDGGDGGDDHDETP